MIKYILSLNLLLVFIILISCNNINNRAISLEENDSLIHLNCIKSFKIDRPQIIGMDGLIFEISICDSLINLFEKNRILRYRPIHPKFSTYPFNFSSPDKVLYSNNKSVKIIQGTTLFYGVKGNKLDSIARLIMRDLIVEFDDDNNRTWRIYPCK